MRTIAAALCASLVLAACGGGDPQKQHVRSTVNEWLASLAVGHRHGDSPRACSHLTRGLQKSITVQLRMRGMHATCKTWAANWTGRATPPGNKGAHVTKVVIRGARARAAVAAPPDRSSEVELRKVGGRWLIDNY
jgi:hypothetical protein